MRKIITTITISMLAASAALLCRCSMTSLGGGTEDVNTRVVTGRVFNPDSTPASPAQVLLIPADYDPLKDARSAILTDTTDGAGAYRFAVRRAGFYTAQIVEIKERMRAMVIRVAVRGDTTVFPTAGLSKPGVVKVMLPSGTNTSNGYMYIPGTTVFAYLQENSGFVMMDSLPAADGADVAYSTTNTSGFTVLRYGVQVKSRDTTVVWNSGWSYSRKIILNTSPSGADITGSVTNFPVLIRLTANSFDFSEARNNGEDIRFTKYDNTFLPYEIERWDPIEKRAEIWVNVDTIYGNDSTQTITMYWDNPDASGNSNGGAVFDTSNGFQGVWHLNRKCDDVIYGRNNGTDYGTTDTTGIIGDCKKFDGSDSIKIAGLLGTPASITMSAWAQLDTVSGENGSEIITIGDAVLIRMDFPVLGHGTMGAIHPYGDSVYYNVSTGRFLKQTGWHFITFTVDQNDHSQTLYIDGSVVRSGNDVISIDYSGVGQNTFIGTHGNGTPGYNFSGRIDEVRVYRKSISADYVKLSFMNQKEQDALVSHSR